MAAGGVSGKLTANGANLDLPSPSFLPPPGPGLSGRVPGRRNHAHRRSAAISSVDLNAITKAFPPLPAAGTGAPAVPLDAKQQPMTTGDTTKSGSRPVPAATPRVPVLPVAAPADPVELAPPNPAPVSLEPASTCQRPLSTVSSESSASTVRPSLPQSEPARQDVDLVRPKTANATFELGEASGKPTKDGPAKRPVSASASVAASGRPSTDVPDVPPLPKGQFGIPAGDTPEEATRSEIPSRAASEKKLGKKKKMRSWAGILTRKGKKRVQKKGPLSRRAPTPPPILTRTNSEIGSLYGLNLDEDNTIIIRTPTRPDHQQMPDDHSSFESAWKPHSFYEQGRESDMFSPVIDLDAALGPFNTPEMGSDQCSGFSLATQRMYSGGRRGQFLGPEMRYHRRTESAPEMPPFDRSALPRFTLNPNPDVFDEEEEDAFLAETDDKCPKQKEDADTKPDPLQQKPDDKPGLGIQVVDMADTPTSEVPTAQASESRPSTVHADTPITPNTNDTADFTRPQYSQDGVEIVDGDQVTSSHNKPLEPTPSRSQLEEKRPVTSPNLCTSKPEFAPHDPDNVSLEVPRLPTASSYMTDRYAFGSGRPASDYIHGSSEDVPSLSSTVSTATGNAPRMPANAYPRTFGDRPGSVTASVPPRSSGSNTSKRSSLISLSKLMGGSSGERSKLSYEQKAPQDEPARTKKKVHRFTRVLHFWKTKEKPKDPSPE